MQLREELRLRYQEVRREFRSRLEEIDITNLFGWRRHQEVKNCRRSDGVGAQGTANAASFNEISKKEAVR